MRPACGAYAIHRSAIGQWGDEMNEHEAPGLWMRLLLRGCAGTFALAGFARLVVGTVEQGKRSGMAGLAAIGLGVVLVIAALSALAPIASARAMQHGAHRTPPSPAPARDDRR